MAALSLQIVTPVDGQALVFGTAAPSVICRGRLVDPPSPGGPLYFRWYSSLSTSAAQDRYSLNQPALGAADLPFDFRPDIGSHVITFAASDRAGELPADLRTITRAGVAGGAEGPTRCRIHVYKARILDQTAQAARASLVLAAEAPWDWEGEGYRQNDALQYRWVFEPTGSPTGRPSASFTPARGDVSFQSSPVPSRLLFRPALPATALGPYQVTLFVEASAGATAPRAQDSWQLQLT